MINQRLTLRQATRADLDGVVAVLCRAFCDDPMIRWFVPLEVDKSDKIGRYFRTILTRDIFPYGFVELAERDNELLGVALWRRPGEWQRGTVRALLDIPYWWRVFGSGLARAGEGQKALSAGHPRSAHWYLLAIGADPSAQGAGVGGRLLRSALRRCDAEGVPAYLEATTRRSASLYERVGFHPLGGERHLPDGPPFWPMWREPK